MAVVTQTMQDNVTELYLGFFGRAPDAAGFGYWTNRLAQGDVTIQQISQAFSKTPEFVSNYDGLTPTQQVTKIYNNVLGRAPDASGLAYWVGQLTTGTQTVADFVWNFTNSAFLQQGTADGLLVQNKVAVGEYFAITLASNDSASAATAYNLVTSNPASVAQAEATLVSATYTLTTAIETVNVEKNGAAITGTQSTFQAADTINGNGKTNLKLNLTDSGTAAWTLPAAGVNGVQTINLQNIGGTPATPAVAQVSTISYASITNAAATSSIQLTNVATNAVTVTIGTLNETTSGADIAVAVASAVNGAAGSLYTATVSGQTVTLTAKTAGAVANAATSTTTPGAGATGGAGNVVITTTGAAAVAAGTYTDIVDMNNFVGATEFNLVNSTGNASVSNVATGQSLGVTGNGVTTNGNLTATLKTGVTSETINLSAGVRGSAVNVTGASVTAATVNSVGATNSLGGLTTSGTSLTINAASALSTGGITNAALNTITVAGAASNVTSTTSTSFNGKVAVDLGTVGTSVTTINASGLTNGGVYARLNSGVTSFVGGNGGDIVGTNGALPAGASINAGTGTDTLIINAAADANTTAAANKYVGFETIEVAFAGSQDLSLFSSATGLNLNAGASATNLNAATAANVTLKATDANATITLADPSGTADVLNITTVVPAAAATAVSLTGLIVSGIENIAFASNGTAASTLSFATSGTAGVATGLQRLTITGTQALTVEMSTGNGASNQAISLLSVDASQLAAQATGTNSFTFQDTGGAHALKNGLTVTGSAGDDVFTINGDTLANGVVATLNGGAGNDLFNVDAGQLYTAGSGYLVINGNTQATSVADKVNVTAGGNWSAADAAFANMSGVEAVNYVDDGNFTLNSGVFFNNAFATGGVAITAAGQAAGKTNTINLSAFTGNDKITLGATNALSGAINITGGSGVDTVAITSALTGNVAANSQVVSTGAGNDSITFTNAANALTTNAGSVAINGGLGADAITVNVTNGSTVAGAVTITTKFGESLFSAYDTISFTGAGIKAVTATNNGVDTAKFVFTEPAGTTVSVAANIAAGSGVTGYTAQQLTYGIANGILSFAGTSAAGLTAAQVMSIVTGTVDAAQANGATFAWADNSGNTWLFNHATTDSVVQLVGTTGATAVSTTAAANTIFIG